MDKKHFSRRELEATFRAKMAYLQYCLWRFDAKLVMVLGLLPAERPIRDFDEELRTRCGWFAAARLWVDDRSIPLLCGEVVTDISRRHAVREAARTFGISHPRLIDEMTALMVEQCDALIAKVHPVPSERYEQAWAFARACAEAAGAEGMTLTELAEALEELASIGEIPLDERFSTVLRSACAPALFRRQLANLLAASSPSDEAGFRRYLDVALVAAWCDTFFVRRWWKKWRLKRSFNAELPKLLERSRDIARLAAAFAEREVERIWGEGITVFT